MQNGTYRRDSEIVFTWVEFTGAVLYRLFVADETGAEVLSAVLVPPSASYNAPPWLAEQGRGRQLSWKIQALDGKGGPLVTTSAKQFTIE
jgi:hypothetical protein